MRVTILKGSSKGTSKGTMTAAHRGAISYKVYHESSIEV